MGSVANVKILLKEQDYMTNRLDLKNQKYGKLTVLRPSDISKRSAWICSCDCGGKTVVSTSHLRSGHTKSCGCIKKEMALEKVIQMAKKNRKYSPKISSARSIWIRVYKDGNLEFEEFLKLSAKNCYYCSAIPKSKYNHQKQYSTYSPNNDFIYNGLDRVDSSKPHDLDNVVPCCKWCNYSKRERSVEEFKKWIIKVHENINSW